MRPPRLPALVARIRAEHLCRELFQLAFALAVVVMLAGQTAVLGGDIFRSAPAATTSGNTATGGTGAAAPVASSVDSAAQLQARSLAAFARTDAAIRAVGAAQQAARAAAAAVASGVPNGWKPGGQPGGLQPLDLSAMDKWKGAKEPTGDAKQVVIVQNEQNALLTWKTFNIGRDTTLTFDQSAGGQDVGKWIAFNYVRDPSGRPSQILGKLNTAGQRDGTGFKLDPTTKLPVVGGQVYVINANGILFGGTAQVNTHGLVASSLPLNTNFIARGLLTNPTGSPEFQFSALKTGTFDPNPVEIPTTSPNGPAVQVAYDPAGTERTVAGNGSPYAYGDVVVQPGATLTAPSSADHIGGRIALIGPAVTNAGSISTADGQAILAAGLQVGFAAHDGADPTLRGLDFYVGKVADASLPNQDAEAVLLNKPFSGTATNAGLDTPAWFGLTADAFAKIYPEATNPKKLNVLGLIDAPRGSVFVAGKAVNQSGVITSQTSVAYNGRVDLLADYGATPNDLFQKASSTTFSYSDLPFVYQAGGTGTLTLGRDSVVVVVPEATSTDKIPGALALPSQVHLQGQTVQFAANAALYAPGADVPVKAKATGIGAQELDAGVTVRAGDWYVSFDSSGGKETFYYSDPKVQGVKMAPDSLLSVAGFAGLDGSGVAASVADNIVAVELRGSELANSPLQRNGKLRGLTVNVDVRQHGAWDPSLNDGAGGYTWVGTPLADTAGWIGLTGHTAAQLSANGGTVSIKSGGAVEIAPATTTGGAAARIDVSGGSIAYAGANVQTTALLQGNRLVDIAAASPDVAYDGIYTGITTTVDPKWGVTTTVTDPMAQGSFEEGYVQGGNGGRLAIAAPSMKLDGSLYGTVWTGPRQMSLAPTFNEGISTAGGAAANPFRNPMFQGQYRPGLSALTLAFQAQLFETNSGTPILRDYSPAAPELVIGTNTGLATDASKVFLSPSLIDVRAANFGGFGRLAIDNSNDNLGMDGKGVGNAVVGVGTIGVAAGVRIEMLPGGSLDLRAGNIAIGAKSSIVARGGSLNFSAWDISPFRNGAIDAKDGTSILAYNPARGRFELGADSLLSTAGLWVDNRLGQAPGGDGALVTKGGEIAAVGSLVKFGDRSIVDVSGGVTVAANGKWSYSDAGKITIKAGQALGDGRSTTLGGGLFLDLEAASAKRVSLRGYAGLGNKGGALDITLPFVRIGSSDTKALPAGSALVLDPAFFSSGGFGNFSLSALGAALEAKVPPAAPTLLQATAVTVAAPVGGSLKIAPTVAYWLPGPDFLAGGGIDLVATNPTGSDRPRYLTTPVSLTLNAPGVKNQADWLGNADLVFGKEVSLEIEAGAKPGAVGLSGGQSVSVFGKIKVPGGEISVSAPGVSGQPSVRLAPNSRLDASGAPVWTYDVRAADTGYVLPGGRIKVTGNIVAEGKTGAEKGAELDVSGTHAELDVPIVAANGRDAAPGGLQSEYFVHKTVSSDGGEIQLTGTQALYAAVTLKGAAGDGAAAGGSLKVRSGVQTADGNPTSLSQATLQVTQSAPVFDLVGANLQTAKVVDPKGDRLSLTDKDGKLVFGGFFGIESFTNGGFASLDLGGSVQFSGQVDLSASRSLSIADGGVILADPNKAGTAVTLSAPYVRLGKAMELPAAGGVSPLANPVDPTYGDAILTVNAGNLIDVGWLALRNLGTVNLNAGVTAASPLGTGDIRGNGVFDSMGAVTLNAGSIYVPTALGFTIASYDHTDLAGVVLSPGSVTVMGKDNLRVPLSAGGTLNVYASTITQNGVLRAPLGTISLGSAGSAQDVVRGTTDTPVLFPKTTTLTLGPGSVTSVSAVDPTTGKPFTYTTVDSTGKDVTVVVPIPYGVNQNGTAWIDPLGKDITLAGNGAAGVGLPAKTVNLNAANLAVQGAAGSLPAAKIDLTGGGDLYSYRWVTGVGGTKDVLASTSSFAVLPAYGSSYAPFAPFADPTSPSSVLLGGDAGYRNDALKIGDVIHLGAVAGLAAGDYVLLPARYALVPGACLVTPSTLATPPLGAIIKPDGASVVAGYRTNTYTPTAPLFSTFEVAPQAVVRARAQYDDSLANTFFPAKATNQNLTAPRVPLDAGHLVAFIATNSLVFKGQVKTGGSDLAARGGLVDIDSPASITIGTTAAREGDLVLDPGDLSGFGAASLLIGGNREETITGTIVTATTPTITVDNAGGSALTGSDVILAATQGLEVKAGATIQATKTSTAADPLIARSVLHLKADSANNQLAVGVVGAPIVFPDGVPEEVTLQADVAGSYTRTDGRTYSFVAGDALSLTPGASLVLDAPGHLSIVATVPGVETAAVAVQVADGALLRMTGDASGAGTVTRGVIAGAGIGTGGEVAYPTLTVAAGAKLDGASGSLALDSSAKAKVDAVVTGGAFSFATGQTILQLDTATPANAGSILSFAALQSLQASAKKLSFTSYLAPIELSGTGRLTLGGAGVNEIDFHGAGVRQSGLQAGDQVTVTAQTTILLDNAVMAPGTLTAGVAAGTLAFETGTFRLGTGTFAVQDFKQVNVKATDAVVADSSEGPLAGKGTKASVGSGSLRVAGDLTIATPLVTGTALADQTVAATGALVLRSSTGGGTIAPGLGAKLTFVGTSIDSSSDFKLPSGQLELHATTGDVAIAGGMIDAGGTERKFNDLNQYTGGGRVELTADKGSVTIAKAATLRLDAFQPAQTDTAPATGSTGNAGTLVVSAPKGVFGVAGAISAKGGVDRTGAVTGSGGVFKMDAGAVPAPAAALVVGPLPTPVGSLGTLARLLSSGGFTEEVSLRIRQGNVTVDKPFVAHSFSLSADGLEPDPNWANVPHPSSGPQDWSYVPAAGKGTITVLPVLAADGQSDRPTIDASGVTGGTITLSAAGNLVVAENAQLTAAALGQVGLAADGKTFTWLSTGFDAAGKGGSISLETRAAAGATLDGVTIRTGASIDLSVAGNASAIDAATGKRVALDPTAAATATATNAASGNFGGTLRLRAPQTADQTDLNLAPIAGSVKGASSIVAEGYRVYGPADLDDGAVIGTALRERVKSEAAMFAGAIGGTAPLALARLLGSAPVDPLTGRPLAEVLHVQPGVEISNPDGDLILPSAWDLSGYRFGKGIVAIDPSTGLDQVDPDTGLPIYVAGSGEPGVLTLRAASNLVFSFKSGGINVSGAPTGTWASGSLTDGFDLANAQDKTTGNRKLWTAILQPAGTRSWSYNLVAGADLSAADTLRVQTAEAAGSVVLGQGSPSIETMTGKLVYKSKTVRAQMVPLLFQTIRTGTGDIRIAAAGDVQIQNPLATIYTAGTRVATPTRVQSSTTDDFDLPNAVYPSSSASVGPNQNSTTGLNPAPYAAQFSYGGGNVTITAQHDITRLVLDNNGLLMPDSSKEMPNNWLYRRGFVGADGKFSTVPSTRRTDPVTGKSTTDSLDVASTAWWVDFSNFFEGVGALGGGNVTLVAGRDVSNVDAVAPTNARMPGKVTDSEGKTLATLAPDATKPVELGGGSVVVRAGGDIDGGVYYVERGTGTLAAGGSIHSNATRSTLDQDGLAGLAAQNREPDPTNWLPTSLFLGKGSFALSATGDLLVSSVANPFLLPQGINNSYFYKTYFSTFAPHDALRLSSLGGDITIKGQVGTGSLATWFASVDYYKSDAKTTATLSQPWLRTVETGVDAAGAFAVAFSLSPATLQATAFSGDINLVGRMNLAPSSAGTVDLLAAKAINGLQPTALSDAKAAWSTANPYTWTTALINLSDADPTRIPGVASPLGVTTKAQPITDPGVLATVNALFNESGATTGVNVLAQTQQALHGRAPGSTTAQPLHAADAAPLHLYAASGDISGLTLFAGKATRVVAGRDIQDIAFYIQNVSIDDLSLVAAGRDLVVFDPGSTLRQAATKSGNRLDSAESITIADGGPNAGDIQISGPGSLEVLAGRNLDLGVASGAPFTALPGAPQVGLTSVGKVRNPLLPSGGADVLAAAGIGATSSLGASQLGFGAFVTKFLDPATAGARAARYLPSLAADLGLDPKTATTEQIWQSFEALPEDSIAAVDRKKRLLLDGFYAVLRTAGRDHNDPTSASYRSYAEGQEAVRTLFPGSKVTPEQTTVGGPWGGNLTMATHQIATNQGGALRVLAPAGNITVGLSTDKDKPDQGILTTYGGDISIFAQGDIGVGRSRIFTLRGGNEILWSSLGNIAAGSGSKTVFAAPPTRVLVDPQSADVQNDLAGLSTGAGIGVLATVKDVTAGDIDLIAPVGTVDAGDAGIRSSGNLNISAAVVANAGNIQTGGTSQGVPAVTVPNVVANLPPGTTTTPTKPVTDNPGGGGSGGKLGPAAELPSLIDVVVTGYGGSDKDEDEKDKEKDGDSDAAQGAPAADQAAAPAAPQG